MYLAICTIGLYQLQVVVDLFRSIQNHHGGLLYHNWFALSTPDEVDITISAIGIPDPDMAVFEAVKLLETAIPDRLIFFRWAETWQEAVLGLKPD